MLKNIILAAFRNLYHQKTYVFINIIGLSIGIAASLLIFTFVKFELSYDNYHKKKDQIYRLILNGKIGGQETTVGYSSSPAGPAMKEEIPGVINFLRINPWSETVIRYNNKNYIEDSLMEVDSTFFDFFSFQLIEGNKKEALNEPYEVVLTKSMAKKIFGEADPIGRSIHIGSGETPYRITGIMQDVPENSHFSCNAIISFVGNPRADNGLWISNSFNTYLLLEEGIEPYQVEEKFPALIKKYIGPDLQQYLGISMEEFLSQGNKYNFHLQPLTKIHLSPEVEHNMKPSGNPKYLYIFIAIGVFILIIAAINYMNLSTARSIKRTKEVGVRKIAGSSRQLLIKQFLAESVLLSSISLLIAIIIIELTLPFFNQILNVNFDLQYFKDWFTIPILLILSFLIGMLSGIYPAFLLSAFKPIKMLGRNTSGNVKSNKLRSLLVVVQFAISMILIIGTLVIYYQINFMLNKDLGFDKDQILIIRRAHVIGDNTDAFKEEIKKIRGVENISSSTAVPFHNNNLNGYQIEGVDEENILLQTNWVDYDYFDTYGIKIVDGRGFDRSFSTDVEGCLINQSAVDNFNLKEPMGVRIINRLDTENEAIYMNVIGVTEDFNFNSLHSEITPYLFIFKTDDRNYGYFSIRLSSDNMQNVIKRIKETWKEFALQAPLQYFFMDDDFENLYQEEKRNARLALVFTFIALVIAFLGLYGLTSFSTEQRTKEIGIRKSLGSSSIQIVLMLLKEVFVLIGIATIISFPIAYYLLSNWLNNFHYRIELSPMFFIIALAISVFITLFTLSFQAYKSAKANPAESLRYE